MVPKAETALDVSSIEGSITFHSRGKGKFQPFVKVLCDLIDCVKQDETYVPIPLTEVEYQQLAARLDDLLDIVGEENHPLAPLLHFVGTLVKNYEDEHVPRLTEL